MVVRLFMGFFCSARALCGRGHCARIMRARGRNAGAGVSYARARPRICSVNHPLSQKHAGARNKPGSNKDPPGFPTPGDQKKGGGILKYPVTYLVEICDKQKCCSGKNDINFAIYLQYLYIRICA